MEFPFLVYKCPGTHPKRDGGRDYDFKQVCSDADLQNALADGWHETYEKASELPARRGRPPKEATE